jgi:elongation factor Ts
MIAKIVDGRVDKYYATCCLLEQAYIKNPDQSVGDFIKTKISELGENIQVRRFVRYAVGEDA